MVRSLVTGGAGFIGSQLVTMLLDRGDEVLVVDDQSVGNAVPAPGTERVTVATAALGSAEAEQAVVGFAPDSVYHLAALHFIPWCEQHPDEAETANVTGTAWLLGVLGDLPVERLVFASTVAVYGFHDEPAVETLPRTPNSVYAHTKVAAEDLLNAYAEKHPDVTVGLARLANVYGRGDRNEHLIPMLCRDLGHDIRAGNLWPRRDYVHVTDVARAFMAFAELPAGVHTYNVATGVGTTVQTIVEQLVELSGVPMSIVSDPARQRADDGHLVASSAALQAATDWRPQVDVRAGLADLLVSVGHDVKDGGELPRNGVTA